MTKSQELKIYKTTKRQCQITIDKYDNVCDHCGKKITPIETTDNAGNPTFWAGCFHGTEFGNFTYGVPKEIFELAEKLVCDGEQYYRHNKKRGFADTIEKRLYWFQTEVSGFCELIRKIEHLKTHYPRKSKKEFLKGEWF
ncbi:MAG: hypothetical protein GWP19_15100 [Planctomycetia bacterium]|nr:hypothetical protein [Planctomycetia bacterium]